MNINGDVRIVKHIISALILVFVIATTIFVAFFYKVETTYALSLTPPSVELGKIDYRDSKEITVKIGRSPEEVGDLTINVSASGDYGSYFSGDSSFVIPASDKSKDYTFKISPIDNINSLVKLSVDFLLESQDSGISNGMGVQVKSGVSLSVNLEAVASPFLYVKPIEKIVVEEVKEVVEEEVEEEEEEEVAEEKKEEILEELLEELVEEEIKEELKEEELKEEIAEELLEEIIKEEIVKELVEEKFLPEEEVIEELAKEEFIEELAKEEFIEELVEEFIEKEMTEEEIQERILEEVAEEKERKKEELRKEVQKEAKPVIVTVQRVDFSGDGQIDASDVSTMANAFTGEYNPQLDLDGDGKVATRDLSVLLSNWTAPLPVPKKPPPIPVGPPLKEDKVVLHTLVDDKGSGVFVAASRKIVQKKNTFKTYVLMDTGSSGANAAEMDFYYDSSVMTLNNINIDSSIFSLWIEEPDEITPGHIRFIGGAPDGFVGTDGSVMELEFEKKPDKLYAPVSFTFAEDAKVYKANGTRFVNLETKKVESIFEDEEVMSRFEEKGIEKPKKEIEIDLSVLKPTLNSSTHPLSNNWYKTDQVTIIWDSLSKKNIPESYLYILSKQEEVTKEDLTEETKIPKARFLIQEDGVWYFHVARFIRGNISEISSMPIYIDKTKPFLLYSRIEDRTEHILVPKYFLVFNSIDRMSGIGHYEIIYNEKKYKIDKNEFELPDSTPGEHVFKLLTYDNVGNFSTSEVNVEIYKKGRNWHIILPIVALIIIILIFVFQKKKRRIIKI